MNKRFVIPILITVLIAVPVLSALGQPPPPPPPNGAPIDGLSGILVMIAGALAGKKFMDSRKSANR